MGWFWPRLPRFTCLGVVDGASVERDEEEYELLLADEALRLRFYERLTRFSNALAGRDEARAYYGCVSESFGSWNGAASPIRDVGVEAALAIDQIINDMRIVNWTTNVDVQNRMRTRIEDKLFELKERHGVELSFDQIDRILDDCLDVARVRLP